MQVSVIEEQKQEAAEQLNEKNELGEADSSSQPHQTDPSDTKPDMNDAAMEESQVIMPITIFCFILR